MYGATVDLRVYTVRGESFEFGSMLSPGVKERATKTVALIAALLQQIHPKEHDCFIHVELTFVRPSFSIVAKPSR